MTKTKLNMISLFPGLRFTRVIVGLFAAMPMANVAAESTSAPATTLSAPATATLTPDAAGFIRRWLILEPIPTNGLSEAVVRETVISKSFSNQPLAVPQDGEPVKIGDLDLSWHAVDTKLFNLNLYHFAHALSKPTSNVLFWAITVVNCPEEIAGVRLAIGSNAASIWWLNGHEVVALYNDRQTTIDDGVSQRLTLKKGPNIVRCAIVNAGGATDFCARFLDAEEKPLTGYTLTLRVPGKLTDK
jgi:hypothetical protein